MSASPGWYDDPTAPGRQRYFDGAAWTGRTQTAPGTTTPRRARGERRAAPSSDGSARRLPVRTVGMVVAACALVALLSAAVLVGFGSQPGASSAQRRSDALSKGTDAGVGGMSDAVPPVQTPTGTLCSVLRQSLGGWTLDQLGPVNPAALPERFVTLRDPAAQAADTCTGTVARGGAPVELVALATNSPESAQFVITSLGTALRSGSGAPTGVTAVPDGITRLTGGRTTTWVALGATLVAVDAPTGEAGAADLLQVLRATFAGR